MRNPDEKKPLRQLLLHDQEYLKQGYTSLTGVDEAGRGPWAGPVVASAVIVRDFSFSREPDDSKKLSPKAREALYGEILAKCRVGVGIVDAGTIDRVNILQATYRAMEEAVEKLGAKPDQVLVDGNRLPKLEYRMTAVVDGDAKSFSIACASVIAKVTRDRLMDYYDEVYPGYGFAKHKGYGTPEHTAALKAKGPCKIHRMSFEPVKKLWKRS